MKYFLRNLTNNDVKLLNKERSNIGNGLIGYMNVSFDGEKKEFFAVFTAVTEGNLTDGKKALFDFIGFLRTAPVCPIFRSVEDMKQYCDNLRVTPEFTPIVNSTDVCVSGGCEDFQFFVRCCPEDADAIVYCYQKSALIEKGFMKEGGI